MSKEVKYRCNLCWEEIKEKEDLLCLFWNPTIKRGDTFGSYELTQKLDSSDKHICKDCYNLIKNR